MPTAAPTPAQLATRVREAYDPEAKDSTILYANVALDALVFLAELLEAREGQPIQNAARALLRAADDAERSAALGDLYAPYPPWNL